MGSGVLSCKGLLQPSGEPVAGGVPFALELTCCGVRAGTLHGRLHAERQSGYRSGRTHFSPFRGHRFTSSGPLVARDSHSSRASASASARSSRTSVARSTTGLDLPSDRSAGVDERTANPPANGLRHEKRSCPLPRR